jgi:hypothetical protein
MNDLTATGLREVLRDVERDEAQAIFLLVTLLDKVRETSDTTPLKDVCATIVQWQDRPPNAIVRSLEDIGRRWDGMRKGHE